MFYVYDILLIYLCIVDTLSVFIQFMYNVQCIMLVFVLNNSGIPVTLVFRHLPSYSRYPVSFG